MVARRNGTRRNHAGVVADVLRVDGGGTSGVIPGSSSMHGNAGRGVIQKPLCKLAENDTKPIELVLFSEDLYGEVEAYENQIVVKRIKYSKYALNDTLMTMLGEISPTIHDRIVDEAEAIATTILNRIALIYMSRGVVKKANEISVKWTKKKQNAIDLMNSVHGWISNSKDVERDVELSEIVKAKGQYIGYAPGRKRYNEFYGKGGVRKNRKMSYKDKECQKSRWDISKAALIKMISKKPSEREQMIEFKANYVGTKRKERKLKANEKRIGGNDFQSPKANDPKYILLKEGILKCYEKLPEK